MAEPLVALALQPQTFDPMRATLAGASLLGSQIQNATALQELRMAPERNALALEQARRQNALAQMQLDTAQRRQSALSAFQQRGGMGNASALSALSGDPELFSGALTGYGAYQNWQNLQRARAGQRVLAAGPEGSDARNQAWRQELDNGLRDGLLTPDLHAQMASQPPTDLRLQGIIDLAKPLTNELSPSDVLRLPVGGGQAPPPSASVGPSGSFDPSMYIGRELFGLNPPADVVANAPAAAQAQERIRELEDLRNRQSPSPQVRGWLSTEAAAQTPAPVPGTALSRQDSAIPSPAWALGEASPPAALSGPRTIGDQIRGLSEADRSAAMLLLAKKDYGELAKLLNNSSIQEQTAAAQARGKASGEAQAALPTAMQNAQSMIHNIDSVINDDYRESVTGWQGQEWWRNPQNPSLFGLQSLPINPLTWLPNSPRHTDTRERIAQIQGQAFLQAFQSLRGAGQISEQEGAKAQAALTRLGNLAQSDEGYLTALFDARREIWNLMNVARTRAGQQPIPYVPHSTERAAETQTPPTPDAEGWVNLPGGVRMREVR